jgi:hypothetical protein
MPFYPDTIWLVCVVDVSAFLQEKRRRSRRRWYLLWRPIRDLRICKFVPPTSAVRVVVTVVPFRDSSIAFAVIPCRCSRTQHTLSRAVCTSYLPCPLTWNRELIASCRVVPEQRRREEGNASWWIIIRALTDFFSSYTEPWRSRRWTTEWPPRRHYRRHQQAPHKHICPDHHLLQLRHDQTDLQHTLPRLSLRAQAKGRRV